MLMVIIVLYLLGCLVTGIMGRKTVIGFLGHFFLSVLITPIFDFLIQVVARPNRDIRRKLEEIGQ
jgi:hypothetical protein